MQTGRQRLRAPAQAPNPCTDHPSLIIALCAALSAAAAPLLESPARSAGGDAARWVQAARQQLSTCQHDVAYLVALGRLLRVLGHPEEAAEHLERALLLSPQNPAAVSAFAAVLADLGDPQGARQLRALLGPEPGPAEPGRAAAKAGPDQKAQWRYGWGLSSGLESNLLGVSGVSSLTLTLPGLDPAQPVLLILPLDAASQPRSGGYWQVQASAQWAAVEASPQRGRYEDLWLLQTTSRLRYAPSVWQAGFATAELAASHQRRYGAGPWGHHAQLSSVYLESRTGVAYAQHSLGLGADAVWGPCQARAGLEWGARRYARNEILDGRQYAAYAQASCSPALQLTLRKGADAPHDANRPGGTQDLIDARARGAWGGWSWEVEWSTVADRLAYSPLLNAGAVREQTRRTWRIERMLPVNAWAGAAQCAGCKPWRWVLGVESNRRNSNLDLFKTNNLGVFLSVISQN